MARLEGRVEVCLAVKQEFRDPCPALARDFESRQLRSPKRFDDGGDAAGDALGRAFAVDDAAMDAAVGTTTATKSKRPPFSDIVNS